GGTPLDTGATFTTNVTGTTTFYATSTVGGGSASVGVVSPASLSGVSTADYDMYYMSFDMLGTGGTIKSVDIFPNVTPGASFTIQIQNSAGTVLFSQQGVTTVQGPTTPQTVPMGFYLPAGTGYRFKFAATMPSMHRNTSGAVYPYTIPGVISMTGNNFNQSYWYYFYNVQVCTGSDSARTPVVVTVNPKPATPTITRGGIGDRDLTSSAATGNQWLMNGTPISGATSQTYTATANGNYAVVVTDNGCSSDTSAVVNITNTGIKGDLAGMNVSVYPNPNNGQFSVKL